MVRYTVVISALLLVAGVHHVAARVEHAELKLRMLQGHPVVDGVRVNGHGPYRFLIDTGTTLNHLDPKLAKSIGLTASFHTDVVSATGHAIAPGSEDVEVTLGELHAASQTFLLAGLESVRQLSPDIQGVLGQAFLSQFDYRLDVRAGRLAFGTADSAGLRVPFRMVHGRPAVSTSLGWLILDSGAQRLVLFGVVGEPEDGSFEMVTMAGAQRVGVVSRQLRIAGKTFWSGDAVGLPLAAEADVAGLLPINLFRAVYVCNSGGYVVLD